MGERMVIAFDHISDADRRSGIGGDGEADRVGTVAVGEAAARSAGIPQVAHAVHGELIRLPERAGLGLADACPRVAEGQHAGALTLRANGIEIGAGHFGGIVTQGMSTTRLETLKSMVAQNPGESFLRYGLAMEYRNSGDLESAIAEFRALIAANPDYPAAYFHGGQTLERMGRADDARAMYAEGIEASTRKGDLHTRDEIRAALDLLG
jgi:tetratricopeptide (TPR) repeat protein